MSLNNTAEFGGIAFACTNSNVTVMDDLVIAQDPIFPACTLYDGHINQYDSTDPNPMMLSSTEYLVPISSQLQQSIDCCTNTCSATVSDSIAPSSSIQYSMSIETESLQLDISETLLTTSYGYDSLMSTRIGVDSLGTTQLDTIKATTAGIIPSFTTGIAESSSVYTEGITSSPLTPHMRASESLQLDISETLLTTSYGYDSLMSTRIGVDSLGTTQLDTRSTTAGTLLSLSTTNIAEPSSVFTEGATEVARVNITTVAFSVALVLLIVCFTAIILLVVFSFYIYLRKISKQQPKEGIRLQTITKT